MFSFLLIGSTIDGATHGDAQGSLGCTQFLRKEVDRLNYPICTSICSRIFLAKNVVICMDIYISIYLSTQLYHKSFEKLSSGVILFYSTGFVLRDHSPVLKGCLPYIDL